jgi:hypothetical protein
MTETLQDIEDIVWLINNDLYNKIKDDDLYSLASLHSDGGTRLVKFLGVRIWDSEDDLREWDDIKDDYEPLEPYLRKEMNKVLDKLRGVVL